MKEKKEEKLEQWHTPFFASYEIDFRRYEDVLEIESSHLLETSSEVDILTVKKLAGARIDNGIGEAYRNHNLIEYKCPSDSLGFETYLQVMGYAYLYMRLERIWSFDEVLVSMMGYNYPEKMIEELVNMGYTLTKDEDGVYLLSHRGMIPVQVVLIHEIDKEKYPWISAIKDKVSDADARRVLEQIADVSEGRYVAKAREVTDLIIRRLVVNNQKGGVFKMNETRNLFKEEFEEKDRKIHDLSEELKNRDEELKNRDEELKNRDEELKNSKEELKTKDSMIERLKAEVIKLGGNVAAL